MINATILDLVNADHRSKAYRQARLVFGMPMAQWLEVNEAIWQQPIMSADESIRIWLGKVFRREMNYPWEWEEDKALELLFCGATRHEYLRECLCRHVGLPSNASELELRAACVADFRELAETQFFYHREMAPMNWSLAYREPDPWEPRGAENESFGDVLGVVASYWTHLQH